MSKVWKLWALARPEQDAKVTGVSGINQSFVSGFSSSDLIKREKEHKLVFLGVSGKLTSQWFTLATPSHINDQYNNSGRL